MDYIVGYQINVDGKSEGLTIPTGFTIIVLYAVQKVINDSESTDFAQLTVQLCTFNDPAFTTQIKINDDLIAQGFESEGNMKKYFITSDDLNKTVRTLIKDNVRPDLDSAYGSANVVEL